MLLTIHVTAPSTQRNFSKIKLIKFYLTPAMSQENLNELVILLI